MEYEVEIKDSSKGNFTLLLPTNCEDIYHSNEFKEFVNLMIKDTQNIIRKWYKIPMII